MKTFLFALMAAQTFGQGYQYPDQGQNQNQNQNQNQGPNPNQGPGQGPDQRGGERQGKDGPDGEPEEPQTVEPPTPEDLREDLAGTVEGMVEAQSGKDGNFTLRDDKLKKDWKVKFSKADAAKVELLDDDRAVVPAEFKTADGKHVLIADFFLKKAEEGGFEQEKTLVRVVDGKARFAYDKDHKIVAVKDAPPPARKKGKGRKKAPRAK